ncbi:MAG TPA: AI-2E family transporter [Bacteroidota bacterium]|nr:AI-2E family transporter [Bacteroidota bacterium]
MKTPTSNRPALKVAALLAIIIVSFGVATIFPDLVLTLIISALAAFVLKPIVNFLEFRYGFRRSIAIAFVFLLTGGILLLVSLQLIPYVVDRVREMYDGFKNFPLDAKLTEMTQDLSKHIPFMSPESMTQKIHGFLEGGLQMLGESLGNAAGFAVNLLIVPFVTYFILAESDTALKKLIERVPNKYFEMTLNVLNKIQTDLVGYLRGWILDSVIVGILSILAYFLVGVKYAILLGVLAGISNLIPYVGPFVGVVPALLVSVTQFGDFRQVAAILIQMLVVQTLDNTFVQPLCFAKTVDMHPLTVILVLVIGNELMGVAGMLLAIPIATILKASAVETYWGLKNYQITA